VTSEASSKTARRPMRADARRNVSAILDAATECLARDPEMSVADIAADAGVARITLYGHFKTRTDLVDAVLTRTLERADTILKNTDTGGDPREALGRLIASSWQVVVQFRNVLAAAQRELPPERIRGTHDRVLRRVRMLITRGQQSGAFRTDLPKQWLMTVAFSLMHAAAEDVSAGRLKRDQAATVITETLLAAYAPQNASVASLPRRRGRSKAAASVR
jgi:TetR/AcrR family transcriptional regulator, mexCD-oprJ operon repressor